MDLTDAASLAKAISEVEFQEATQLRGRIKGLRAPQIYKT